ncbi:MAG: DUF6051 family protein [Deltaproteobacteria bacterium]|jgi:hypothetical protein|nr:DUF6051 family protein [Deltaproteobacteria bacterium]
MLFADLHKYLKDNVSYEPDLTELPLTGQRIRNFDFRSEATGILAHASNGLVPVPAENLDPEDREIGRVMNSISMTPDHEIAENGNFRYHVIMPGDREETDGALIVIHGFNERHWTKYLPWASHMATETGRAVILFPIAFHMNRSPDLWNDSRLMKAMSTLRKKLCPAVIHSTLSNAAISVRLSANPARFFWSGLQSYFDVNLLMARLLNGEHPGIRKGASVNFFTYSIGTFLGEIIMMTNDRGMYDRAKFVTFCGGPVFNRLSPVSKFILDSEADVLLYSFLVEHLESHFKTDPALNDYLMNDELPFGRNFRSLLNYRLDRAYREEKFAGMADRVLAVALANDEVVPPYEVINTLQGTKRDLKIPVIVSDLPYPYRHEDPFPAGSPKNAAAVDESFRKIFAPICDFLR